MSDPVTDPGAYYLPLGEDGEGELFESTTATSSPWDGSLQHGGPPSALLVRAIERTRSDDSMSIARVTVDFLGGIAQGRIRTEAEVVRAGRRIELVRASLWTGDTLAVTATAWRIRDGEGSTAEHARVDADLPPVPEQPSAPTEYFPGVGPEWGYGRSMDLRFVDGGYDVSGPARVWTRGRIPLVAGEEPTPIQRLMAIADSTNGLSAALPLDEWWFIPPTLGVTLLRPPTTDWLLLDARTDFGPDGTGLARSEISDRRGLVAVVAQPLMVARR